MFRIGDFSKLARVTTRQLRYYQECGLLEPAVIDPETGYRYYSAAQLPRLHRILALKELGLTLEQIARLVDHEVSADEMRGMLTMKKAQVEQMVQAELERIRSIEERIAQIDREGGLHDYEVTIQSIPAKPILSVRETVPTVRDGFARRHEINRVMAFMVARIMPRALAVRMWAAMMKGMLPKPSQSRATAAR